MHKVQDELIGVLPHYILIWNWEVSQTEGHEFRAAADHILQSMQKAHKLKNRMDTIFLKIERYISWIFNTCN